MDIAVVAFAQTEHTGEDSGPQRSSSLAPVITDVKARHRARALRLHLLRVAATTSPGAPFSFVSALDALGAWPPISESHVEMDGAWALYEAWVRLQHGDIDTALVYGFGKPSQVRRETASRPARADEPPARPVLPGAARPRPGVAGGVAGPRVLDRDLTMGTRRTTCARWPPGRAPPGGTTRTRSICPTRGDEDDEVAPLRPYDCAPVTDGAAAIVLAAGDQARELCERPAWIRGIDHRIEAARARRPRPGPVGRRPDWPGAKAGAGEVEVAELHAQFSHEELILREALGLGDDVRVNPSGGPLAANPVMATGLIRIGEAAGAIHRRRARTDARPRALAAPACSRTSSACWRREPWLTPARSSASARPSYAANATTSRSPGSCARRRCARWTTPG